MSYAKTILDMYENWRSNAHQWLQGDSMWTEICDGWDKWAKNKNKMYENKVVPSSYLKNNIRHGSGEGKGKPLGFAKKVVEVKYQKTVN